MDTFNYKLMGIILGLSLVYGCKKKNPEESTADAGNKIIETRYVRTQQRDAMGFKIGEEDVDDDDDDDIADEKEFEDTSVDYEDNDQERIEDEEILKNIENKEDIMEDEELKEVLRMEKKDKLEEENEEVPYTMERYIASRENMIELSGELFSECNKDISSDKFKSKLFKKINNRIKADLIKYKGYRAGGDKFNQDFIFYKDMMKVLVALKVLSYIRSLGESDEDSDMQISLRKEIFNFLGLFVKRYRSRPLNVFFLYDIDLDHIDKNASDKSDNSLPLKSHRYQEVNGISLIEDLIKQEITEKIKYNDLRKKERAKRRSKSNFKKLNLIYIDQMPKHSKKDKINGGI